MMTQSHLKHKMLEPITQIIVKRNNSLPRPKWWHKGQHNRLLFDDPSSIPSEVYIFLFSEVLLETNENKQKEAETE